jgi:glyoxylate reductase
MNKPYVYITRKISTEAEERIRQIADVDVWEGDTPVPRPVLLDKAKQADGLLVMLTDRVDRELLAQASSLKVVSTMSVGVDHIEVEAVKEKGIIVTNTPDVLTDATADLAFALLLATARRIVEANRAVHTGEWRTWSPLFMAGQQVHGRTLGIIGMGRIGTAVAKRAKGFEMNVLYHNRSRKPEAESTLGVQYRALPELLKESDFVVVLTPLTAETKGLIGREELSLMKPTAVLVNVSRGGTVDEQALFEALQTKRIWAAGSDVFQQEPVPADHPLLTLPNFVALPHIGSATVDTRHDMAMLAAENLIAVLTGKEPLNPV